jgi:hypothetical protein
MSRTPAKVTQADIARAIRAIAQTGARLAVEIAPDGTIRLVPVDSKDGKGKLVDHGEGIRL